MRQHRVHKGDAFFKRRSETWIYTAGCCSTVDSRAWAYACRSLALSDAFGTFLGRAGSVFPRSHHRA
jgi:hypothetical protein